MRAREFRGLLAIAMLWSAVGCARAGQAGDQSSSMEAITTARITNNGWLDVNVYALRGGSRQRLGMVTGQNTQVFRLPRNFVDARGVRLFIDPIGSPQGYQTELISVGPGQQIELVVQQRISMSHYSVFDRVKVP
jgi:hypothetical protein